MNRSLPATLNRAWLKRIAQENELDPKRWYVSIKADGEHIVVDFEPSKITLTSRKDVSKPVAYDGSKYKGIQLEAELLNLSFVSCDAKAKEDTKTGAGLALVLFNYKRDTMDLNFHTRIKAMTELCKQLTPIRINPNTSIEFVQKPFVHIVDLQGVLDNIIQVGDTYLYRMDSSRSTTGEVKGTQCFPCEHGLVFIDSQTDVLLKFKDVILIDFSIAAVPAVPGVHGVPVESEAHTYTLSSNSGRVWGTINLTDSPTQQAVQAAIAESKGAGGPVIVETTLLPDNTTWKIVNVRTTKTAANGDKTIQDSIDVIRETLTLREVCQWLLPRASEVQTVSTSTDGTVHNAQGTAETKKRKVSAEGDQEQQAKRARVAADTLEVFGKMVEMWKNEPEAELESILIVPKLTIEQFRTFRKAHESNPLWQPIGGKGHQQVMTDYSYRNHIDKSTFRKRVPVLTTATDQKQEQPLVDATEEWVFKTLLMTMEWIDEESQRKYRINLKREHVIADHSKSEFEKWTQGRELSVGCTRRQSFEHQDGVVVADYTAVSRGPDIVTASQSPCSLSIEHELRRTLATSELSASDLFPYLFL